MPRIEGFRIQNFKTLRDITIGKVLTTESSAPLTPLTAVIGKNGVGKSTLFDAFGFLADCLKSGVEDACDLQGRGGFERIHSHGDSNFISFDIFYNENPETPSLTYFLAIAKDNFGRPYIKVEWLLQSPLDNNSPVVFLFLAEGKGFVWRDGLPLNNISPHESLELEQPILDESSSQDEQLSFNAK